MARFLAPIPTTYSVPTEQTSPRFARAFSLGCLGPTTTDVDSLRPGPFAAFCTPRVWPLLDQAAREGRDYYYGDHAWIRRGKYYRVAKNAVQWQPTDLQLKNARPYRWELLGRPIVPEWKRDGTAIVICPNSVPYMARFGIDASRWALDVAAQISQVSARPITIRWKASATRRPLYHDLDDAWCTVVWNSGAAVESLVAGVPIVTTCSWATTARMGLTDVSQIESPIYPENRERFLWSLAERQWTLPELAAGVAWKTLCRDSA